MISDFKIIASRSVSQAWDLIFGKYEGDSQQSSPNYSSDLDSASAEIICEREWSGSHDLPEEENQLYGE